MRAWWLLLAGALLVSAPALAQESVPAPVAEDGAEADVAARGDAPVEGPFVYDSEGRRDPFVSLVQRGSDVDPDVAASLVGIAALTVNEVALRGVLNTPQGYVALIEGADARSYIVRSGDRLFDGTVRTISQNDMVIVQMVNDPLSLAKQREVRKMLRQIEAN